MSNETKTTIQTVAGTLRNMTPQERREYAALLEGISQGIDIAHRCPGLKEAG